MRRLPTIACEPPNRNHRVALPFCHLTLKSEKAIGYLKLEDSKTLGDHLNCKKMKLGVQFKQIAEILGVSPFTVGNWVKGTKKPSIRHYPAIMDFLGYCPYQRADTIGRKIMLHRIHQGFSQKELARLLGIDAGSLSRWETGERCPREASLRRLWSNRFFR